MLNIKLKVAIILDCALMDSLQGLEQVGSIYIFAWLPGSPSVDVFTSQISWNMLCNLFDGKCNKITSLVFLES